MSKALNTYDLLIIGGGINGTGVALDAAGRGLSVLLCEKNDLGSATSSASSKLIHGGLRYLEQFDIKLVRESLKERKLLSQKAPHLIQPLRFIMPDNKKLRSTWLIRLGLLSYQLLAGKTELPKIQRVNFMQPNEHQPLKKTLKKGFSYYDCQVDDSRLVVLNARQAAELGAMILTRYQVIHATRNSNHWLATLQDQAGKQTQVAAKILINATGPWVNETLERLQCRRDIALTLVKGSHIVLPQLYKSHQAYILQCQDNRIVFVSPFAGQFTLIGTTEIYYQNNLNQITIDKEEINYLCHCVNDYFKIPISPKQVISSFSGVRPLIKNPQRSLATTSRNYTLSWDKNKNLAPLLSIFGGKITTYRSLSEKVVNEVQPYFPHRGPAWTTQKHLPGGNLPTPTIKQYIKELHHRNPWIAPHTLRRYCYAYGTLTEQLLAGAQSTRDLGHQIAGDLYQRELEYLIDTEWVQTAEDLLWRRSKLGLFFNATQVEQVQTWLARYKT